MNESSVSVTVLLGGDVVRFRLNESITVDGVEIPSGFESDGISSPKLLWWAFPQVDTYLREAFYHDYLLDSGVDWNEAERRFKRSLKSRGLSDLKIFIIVNSVRANGIVKRKRK